LLLGLELAREMNIKMLKVIGDSDLIVQQIRNQCAAKNGIMKYMNATLDTIDLIDSFSIRFVPRDLNEQTHVLVIAVANLQPCYEMLTYVCKMKVVSRVVIPNNVENWQVFENDAQVIICLANLQEFSS